MVMTRKLLTRWQFKVDSAKVKAFSNSVSTAKKRVNSTTSSLKKMSAGFIRLGKMAALVGAALTAVVVKISMNQQDALKNTMTMVTKTGDEFLRLEKEMLIFGRDLSYKLGINAKEIFTGFYQVLSTGAKAGTEDFRVLAETGMKFGKVVGLSASDAVERLNDSLKAFGLEQTRATEIADKFFRTTIFAALNVPQLTEALRDAAPVAAGLGVSLNETLAVLAGFAEAGVKGAQAGTAFKMVVTRLAAQTPQAEAAMRELGVSAYDAQENLRPVIDIMEDLQKAFKKVTGKKKADLAQAIAGRLALPKFFGLLNKNMDTLREWVSILDKDASGALENAFGIRMEAASERLNKFKFQITNTAGEIGDELLPKIGDLANAFSSFLTENKEDIAGWGKVVIGWVDRVGEHLGWLGKHLKEQQEEALRLRGIIPAPEYISEDKDWQAIEQFNIDIVASENKIRELREKFYKEKAGGEKPWYNRPLFAANEERLAELRKLRRDEEARVKRLMTGYTKLKDKLNKIRLAKEKAKSAKEGQAFVEKFGREAWAKEMARLKAAAKEAGDKVGGAFAKGFKDGVNKEDPFAFLRPGFGKETAMAFANFLRNKQFGGQTPESVISGFIGRTLPSGAITGEKPSGGPMTFYQTNYIRAIDPEGTRREIERSNRSLARGLGVSNISGLGATP